MYGTFEQYREAGGLLTEAEYAAAAPKAQAEIDYLTFGRAAKCTAMAARLAACECALVDVIYMQQSAVSAFKSENNDGYSVVYAEASERQRAIETICLRYLCSPVNLLYAAVR